MDAPFSELNEVAEELMLKWTAFGPAGGSFSEYFKQSKLPLIRTCVGLKHRLECGLNLDPYTQNANECANSVIKRWTQGKQTLNVFVELMQGLADKQQQDIQLAVIGRTEGYVVHEDYYTSLTTAGDYWDSTKVRTDEDRAAFLKKIHSLPLKVSKVSSPVLEVSRQVITLANRNLERNGHFPTG